MMINIDKYGRAYTQVYSVAEAYRVPDTRDIYVMKIPDYYKQKLLREGLRVKLYHYDKANNTYWLPPSLGKNTEGCEVPRIEFNMISSDLYDYQKDILKAIRAEQSRTAFISSGTGTGKSYMLAGLIALYKVKTLIVVPNISIARGLLEKISKYSSSVFLAQGIKILDATEDIVICHHTTFNTYYEQLNGKYPMLIIDEGHHLPKKRIQQLIFWKGHRIFGLSATPKRKEFDEAGIKMLFGTIYDTGQEALPVRVLIHNFRYDYDSTELEAASAGLAPDSNEIFRRLIINNTLRYQTLIKILNELTMLGYKKMIIFSDRVEHIEKLLTILKVAGYNPIDYYGKTKKSDAESQINSLDDYVIVGHPTSCGEGFDVPELEVSILFTSTGWENAVKQMAGRARRKDAKKKEGLLVDFVDDISIMGGKSKKLSFSKRKKVYKQLDWETTALLLTDTQNATANKKTSQHNSLNVGEGNGKVSLF